MAKPPERPSRPSVILTAFEVATTAKAKIKTIPTMPTSKSPKNGIKIDVHPSFTAKNQPKIKPTTEIRKNLTGPRKPAAPRPEPKILITSSITPTNAPPKKPASGNQVWPRSRLKAQVTIVTETIPINPAIVGKTCLNL